MIDEYHALLELLEEHAKLTNAWFEGIIETNEFRACLKRFHEKVDAVFKNKVNGNVDQGLAH